MEILAREMMTQPVITIREDASIDQLLELLQEHLISGVPVVDTPGHLVGVIALTDVVALGPNEEDPQFISSDFQS